MACSGSPGLCSAQPPALSVPAAPAAQPSSPAGVRPRSAALLPAPAWKESDQTPPQLHSSAAPAAPTHLNSLLLVPRGLLMLCQLLVQLLHLAGHRLVTQRQQAGKENSAAPFPWPSPRTPVADAAVSSANCPQWDQAAGGGSAPNGFAVPKFSALPQGPSPPQGRGSILRNL